MNCDHIFHTSQWIDDDNHPEGGYLFEDVELTIYTLDKHRNKCSQCNTVMYQSEAARLYFEEKNNSQEILDELGIVEFPIKFANSDDPRDNYIIDVNSIYEVELRISWGQSTQRFPRGNPGLALVYKLSYHDSFTSLELSGNKNPFMHMLSTDKRTGIWITADMHNRMIALAEDVMNTSIEELTLGQFSYI